MACQIGEVSMAENLTAGCHRMSPMVRLCISKNQHDNLPIWEEVIYFEEATKGFLVSYLIYVNNNIYSKASLHLFIRIVFTQHTIRNTQSYLKLMILYHHNINFVFFVIHK